MVVLYSSATGRGSGRVSVWGVMRLTPWVCVCMPQNCVSAWGRRKGKGKGKGPCRATVMVRVKPRARIQDTGYRIQDTGYRILDTGYRIHDT